MVLPPEGRLTTEHLSNKVLLHAPCHPLTHQPTQQAHDKCQFISVKDISEFCYYLIFVSAELRIRLTSYFRRLCGAYCFYCKLQLTIASSVIECDQAN